MKRYKVTGKSRDESGWSSAQKTTVYINAAGPEEAAAKAEQEHLMIVQRVEEARPSWLTRLLKKLFRR